MMYASSGEVAAQANRPLPRCRFALIHRIVQGHDGLINLLR